VSLSSSDLVGFFDHFPNFYDSGNAAPVPSIRERLNARYEAIIESNLPAIRGKRILDLGSHDGRWSFAAVQAGAERVIGIEPRPELVESANAHFSDAGVDASRYEFIVGDALEVLSSREIRVDTAFVLGIFYHLDYHVSLLGKLRETGAETMIVDTLTSPDRHEADNFNNTIAFIVEATDPNENASNEIYPGAHLSLVGHPSRNFMHTAFGAFGYSFAEIDWSKPIQRWGNSGIGDYETGTRGTFVATRSDRVGWPHQVAPPSGAASLSLRHVVAHQLRRVANRLDVSGS
jgi:cyclopropane fatty-acyl-phospholipid synthase-like methyltransferase